MEIFEKTWQDLLYDWKEFYSSQNKPIYIFMILWIGWVISSYTWIYNFAALVVALFFVIAGIYCLDGIFGEWYNYNNNKWLFGNNSLIIRSICSIILFGLIIWFVENTEYRILLMSIIISIIWKFDARVRAILGMLFLVYIVISLLIDNQGSAQLLAVRLYYTMVLSALSWLINDSKE